MGQNSNGERMVTASNSFDHLASDLGQDASASVSPGVKQSHPGFPEVPCRLPLHHPLRGASFNAHSQAQETPSDVLHFLQPSHSAGP